MINSTIYQSPLTIKTVTLSKSRANEFQSTTQLPITNSPAKAQISIISQKLSTLTNNDERTLKVENYEQRLEQLDQKYQKSFTQDITRIQNLQDILIKLEDSLNNEKQLKSDQLEVFKNEKIQQFEQHIIQEIQKDKNIRKEQENKINIKLEEQIYQLRLQVLQQCKTRYDLEEDCQNEIGNRIIVLSQDVQIEKQEREQQCQQLINRFGGKVFQVQETLNNEKQARQNSHNQMQQMIEEMRNVLSLQLQEEQIQREQTQETLLRLLNDTCNKVSNSLKN